MRTTVDLPEDLHRTMTTVARERGATLSAVIADFLRRGLGAGSDSRVRVDPETGLPIVRTGVPLTTEDVRALDDAE
jgi:hypothetical protein